MGPRTRSHRGFSVLEIIVVMAIIALLAAIAVPRYAGAIARQRVEAVASRIVADLRLAQKRAVTTGTSQTVTFDVGSNEYELAGVRHLDHSDAPYIVELGAEPYGATLLYVGFGGGLETVLVGFQMLDGGGPVYVPVDGHAEIIFDGYGVPDGGGSVVVRVGDHFRVITVDPDTGQASVSTLVASPGGPFDKDAMVPMPPAM